VVAGPVALGVTGGALIGSRVLPLVNVEALRWGFIVILLLIAVEMAWRAIAGL
jgi:uncharacterized membrane protein YfcA